jgi:hypothetical protein
LGEIEKMNSSSPVSPWLSYDCTGYRPSETQRTAAFDVFGLGALIVQLVIGEAVSGKRLQERQERIWIGEDIRLKMRPHSSAEFVSLVRKCWSKDPLRRSHIDKIIEALTELQSRHIIRLNDPNEMGFFSDIYALGNGYLATCSWNTCRTPPGSNARRVQGFPNPA